ncbi:MAG: mechanosensitive ion channel protein [Burkholderiales bacterium RIFCSPLOWO2_02_FULL_57_36]|nr:MAG: mechanosensitive ion channel protein [Burkholderiales bacterium RIFCSPLOWO2_02_FULL_57_36]
MTHTPLSNLWPATMSDLLAPGMLWQIGTVAACIALGWLLARLLRGKIVARGATLRVMRLGVESFARVLSPVLALILIAIAKPILAQWYPVDLLRVAMPLVGSFALIRLMFYVLHKAFARGGRTGSFLLLFEKLFATLVWVGVAIYIVGWWPGMVQYLDETTVPIGRHSASLLTMVQAAASVAVTLILALWVGAILEERLMQLDTMHSSLRAVMARMGRATLILVAVLVSLSLVGIDLTVLSVFGGALGVGIGLGLQKLVSSYVSGFVILLERSLAIGDMVTVDKYSGRVTQINTRYTVLRAGDGVEAVIPNEMLVSGPVQNFSLTDRLTRLATQVTVGYETDVDLVLPLLEEASASIARVAKEPPPCAFLLKFGADGLELELGFWISDPENGRLGVLSDVNKAIWQALRTHQINIPYPQRELRLIDRQFPGKANTSSDT